jgi:hypothetical protein
VEPALKTPFSRISRAVFFAKTDLQAKGYLRARIFANRKMIRYEQIVFSWKQEEDASAHIDRYW